MARPTSSLLTDREAQIMEILWERGQATADDVRAALPDRPHDSSVRTLLRVLCGKRYVRMRRGRPFVYFPRVERGQVQQRASRSLLDRFFGGSAESLVLRLLEDERLTPEQLDELKKAYQERATSERRGES